MDTIRALTTMLPLAVSSGINLYATILVVGLSIRYGLVTDVPQVFTVLASWPVILTAGFFYVLEFFADKIQFVDHLWDTIHTFIRPFGAAVIAFSAVGEVDPSLALVAALISGSAALVSHGGKAGGRVALNTMSPAENISNIGVSLAEDVLVGVLAVLALKYPVVAAVIAGTILLLIIIFIPPLLRWSWFNVSALIAWLKGTVRPVTRSEELPTPHAEMLPNPATFSLRCRAQGVKGANGKVGYLSLAGSEVCFTTIGWLRSNVWCIPRQQLTEVVLHSRLLMDVLEMHFTDQRNKKSMVRFVCTRDRRQLVAEIVQKQMFNVS
jgi:hypothetical protein